MKNHRNRETEMRTPEEHKTAPIAWQIAKICRIRTKHSNLRDYPQDGIITRNHQLNDIGRRLWKPLTIRSNRLITYTKHRFIQPASRDWFLTSGASVFVSIFGDSVLQTMSIYTLTIFQIRQPCIDWEVRSSKRSCWTLKRIKISQTAPGYQSASHNFNITQR